MPHSTVSDPVDTSSQAEEDELLPDASAQALDGLKDEDSDDANEEGSKPNNSTHQASKADVKLEDIFNDDDDEDEEFPSSGATTGKVESSPLAAPL